MSEEGKGGLRLSKEELITPSTLSLTSPPLPVVVSNTTVHTPRQPQRHDSSTSSTTAAYNRWRVNMAADRSQDTQNNTQSSQQSAATNANNSQNQNSSDISAAQPNTPVQQRQHFSYYILCLCSG